MPKVQAGGITMNYDQQGSGEPLVLIPYLAADHACYAFQIADYSKHFTCISVDLRGTGESDKPGGVYSTEMFADDIAALMQAIGASKAHVAGLSLGAATGIWLAAKYPDRVKSLSLQSGWPKSPSCMRNTGLHPGPVRLRARPPRAAGRCVHLGVRCGDGSRRRGAAWQDSRSDADHLRAARHGHVHPASLTS